MEDSVRSGNLERVQELIQGGADVNACCKGTPLLSLAIKNGHNRVAVELIHHGANVHAKDIARGRTALHWACEVRGHENVVQLLIDRGISVNEKDEQGKSPLLLAAKWGGMHGLANCLLRAGANCQAIPLNQKNLLVRYACLEGDCYVVKTLIANGCNINTTYVDGITVLMKAVEEGFESIVKLLILAGANLDLQDPLAATALHYAALYDQIQCGVLLVEGGANVGIKDKHSRTALKVARSEGFKEAIKQAQSFIISKLVCIVGNTGVGKSTLITTLKAERNSLIGKTFNRFWRVADHRKRTAGIETIHHCSQRYGETLFFDFAGQYDYYGPHQAFLQSFLSKHRVSMTLLLVVKATDRKEVILDQLHHWLFPIAQIATSATIPPQIIVIGSFLDRVESKGEATSTLLRCINETRECLNDIMPLIFRSPCILNCRQPQSEGIDQLCHFLREVPIPKLKAIHTQYSLVWVLSQIKLAFKGQPAVPFHTLAKWMQENRDNLPQTNPSPDEVCKDLSAAGHALYLPNKDRFHDGWLVLDLAHILHDFYGTLFSQPKENINRFGLLHRKELAQLFPQMCLEMVQQLLITLEFCTPVDPMVLSEDVTKLTASGEDDGWLFFPTFVSESAKPPKTSANRRVCSLWWQLKTSGKHFLYIQVLQSVFLHLAAHFVMRRDRAAGKQQHHCYFWQNGISWQTKEGVDVSVCITNRDINVVSESEETADRLCQYVYVTEVIADIISTVRQISPNLKADAYIVHRPAPSCTEMFPVSAIKNSINDISNKHLLGEVENSRSSRVLVSDLFGGHTPSLEDMERIFWEQRDPMQQQYLLAEIDAHLPVIRPPIVPAQLYHLSHPTFVFVSNPVVSWLMKLIYYL